MRSFRYRRQQQVAVPVVPAMVRAATSTKRPLHIRFRLDTGADVTLIPSDILLKLEPNLFDEIVVADFQGRTSILPAYQLDLRIGGYLFDTVAVVASEGGSALLGLDILNQLNLNLNGPKKELVIL